MNKKSAQKIEGNSVQVFGRKKLLKLHKCDIISIGFVVKKHNICERK